MQTGKAQSEKPGEIYTGELDKRNIEQQTEYLEKQEDKKMIQDIAPHTYHNEYRPVPPKEDSFLLYFEERKALAAWDTPELAFPRFQDYPEVERRLSDRVI